MEYDCDIIVIGGGLAGLIAGIHLSLANRSVLLIEKNTYPKHKVCGEYVSNEVLPYLQELGINPLDQGAKEINRFQFSGLTGKSLEIGLPLGGFGISRYTLDKILLDRALECGVSLERALVTDVSYDDHMFKVSVKNKNFRAPYVIGAYGKRSKLDSTLLRNFKSKQSPWLAVKSHYEADFPEDLVALHNFEGGYCGLSKVETDAVNVCYLADYKSFKKYKDLYTYRVEVLEKNRYLKSFFKKSQPIFDTPLTISQISFQNKSAVERHILMVGDSAGLIHPLCGNGMAMAIHSAKIACECILDHLALGTKRECLEKNYIKEWSNTFSARMRNGALIQRSLRSKIATNIGVRFLQKSPSILTQIIKSTHGNRIV